MTVHSFTRCPCCGTVLMLLRAGVPAACALCGADRQPSVEAHEEHWTNAPKRNPAILFVVGALVAALLLCVVMLWRGWA